MTDDNWAGGFAARIAQKQQTVRDEGRLLLTVLGMRTAQSPLLWEDLRQSINQKAQNVNAVGQYFTVAPLIQHRTEHTVESPAGHLALVFESEIPRIKFTFTKRIHSARAKPEQVNGDLTFQVFDEQVWLTDKNEKRMGTSEAAEFFLEMHS